MSEDDVSHRNRNKSNHSTREISTLERREIQAPLLVSLINGFTRELGQEKAMQVATVAIRTDAREIGKTMAGKYGGNSTRELLQVVRQIWAEDDALGYDILEQTDQRLSFNVNHCRYAEMYARLGMKEFGYCLSCNRDESFISGFNPRMKLIRTQTIMEGGEKCDFRISVEEK
ncbi:MAG: L-2-amino-thiazoline-4-carboxylic acid hydrolase [Anaerolineales bacterium]|jgi:hypothetical protein